MIASLSYTIHLLIISCLLTKILSGLTLQLEGQTAELQSPASFAYHPHTELNFH